MGEIRVSAYVADGFLGPESGYSPVLRNLGADGVGRVLVAVDGAEIVGTVMLGTRPGTGELVRSPGDAEIRALAVEPGSRGRGIGAALVRAVIDAAAESGVQNLMLATQTDMRSAHRLYERAGFVRLADRDFAPIPGLTLLVYGLPPDQMPDRPGE